MKRILLIIFYFAAFLGMQASEALTGDSVTYRTGIYLGDTVMVRVDNHRDSLKPDNWVQQLIKNRFNVNDTTLRCPKFVDFCLDLYRWGDKTFNSYDSTYVYSCPKKWKVTLKFNSKWDTYHLHAREKTEPSMFFNTDPRYTAGFRISFMAVGFEYMPDIDNLLEGREIFHRRTRFSFTCSRIIAEAYYNKNTGTSRLNRWGNYKEGRLINEKFDGLSSSTLGVDVFYVFNNKKYAHAAAYCFSKIQRRSAGSFILGLQYANQDFSIDLSCLPLDIVPHNPWPNKLFRLHHYDYAINIGYGYNWVFHHNWLFNIMASPSIGLSHTVIDDIDTPGNKMACNIRARMALVRNAGNFFYGFNASFNGFFSWSKKFMLLNLNNDATFSAGFRF